MNLVKLKRCQVLPGKGTGTTAQGAPVPARASVVLENLGDRKAKPHLKFLCISLIKSCR